MKILFRVWHSLYYYLGNRRLEKAALTCQEAVIAYETGHTNSGLRLSLHLSLCQSCRNYVGFSRTLRQRLGANHHVKVTKTQVFSQADELTQRLLRELTIHENHASVRPHQQRIQQ